MLGERDDRLQKTARENMYMVRSGNFEELFEHATAEHIAAHSILVVLELAQNIANEKAALFGLTIKLVRVKHDLKSISGGVSD
jgi:hypothetical protein